ncbi:MAG TPA: hypothetical protein GX400_08470 [Chloroflexi bacterium]|nr:hypothetical protein [Chloroflexota bacterium]
MKHQHQQPEEQSPLTAGDALPNATGRPAHAASGPAADDASAQASAPVVTLNAPEADSWWEEEDSMTRTGGVCLLIA